MLFSFAWLTRNMITNAPTQEAYPTYLETKYLIVTTENSTHLLPSLLQRWSNFISCWGNLSYSTRSPCCSLIVWKSTSLIKSEYKTNGSSSSVSWTERLYGYTKINMHTYMNNKQIQNTKYRDIFQMQTTTSRSLLGCSSYPRSPFTSSFPGCLWNRFEVSMSHLQSLCRFYTRASHVLVQCIHQIKFLQEVAA
jgi:hypothetical protein